VTALVVSGAVPPLEEVRDLVKSRLPAWCAPHRLIAIDNVPRTALGKPRRADAVALASQYG